MFSDKSTNEADIIIYIIGQLISNNFI